MGARARASGEAFARARSFLCLSARDVSSGTDLLLNDLRRAFFGVSVMSNASLTNRPLGTAMVGGAIAMAILDLLVRKNILTVDDVQGALTTAQSSLISSPSLHGSLDGARVIGEIKDLFARRERGQWNERRR
jgi:hypothetical protein